jgi:hypothetical protein
MRRKFLCINTKEKIRWSISCLLLVMDSFLMKRICKGLKCKKENTVFLSFSKDIGV